MRDRAWRRAQTRRVQQHRVALNKEIYPYMPYIMDNWWDERRKARFLGSLRDSRLGCGCGGCKEWKHKAGRGEHFLMKHSDRKRFVNIE